MILINSIKELKLKNNYTQSSLINKIKSNFIKICKINEVKIFI